MVAIMQPQMVRVDDNGRAGTGADLRLLVAIDYGARAWKNTSYRSLVEERKVDTISKRRMRDGQVARESRQGWGKKEEKGGRHKRKGNEASGREKGRVEGLARKV